MKRSRSASLTAMWHTVQCSVITCVLHIPLVHRSVTASVDYAMKVKNSVCYCNNTYDIQSSIQHSLRESITKILTLYNTVSASVKSHSKIPVTQLLIIVNQQAQWRRKMFQYGGALDRIARGARTKILTTPTFDRKTRPFGH